MALPGCTLFRRAAPVHTRAGHQGARSRARCNLDFFCEARLACFLPLFVTASLA